MAHETRNVVIKSCFLNILKLQRPMDHTVQLMLIKCHGTEYYFLEKKLLKEMKLRFC